jgi:U3 small nucleolar RNA-associated protein 25
MIFIVSDMSLADNSKEKDGEEPPGVSQKSSEEFTDVKHESLFSLETNFLEEDSGGSCSQRPSQGESGSCCPNPLVR